jgi:hypothetical protein
LPFLDALMEFCEARNGMMGTILQLHCRFTAPTRVNLC